MGEPVKGMPEQGQPATLSQPAQPGRVEGARGGQGPEPEPELEQPQPQSRLGVGSLQLC